MENHQSELSALPVECVGHVSMAIMILARVIICEISLKSSTQDHMVMKKGVSGIKHFHWAIN